MRITATPNTKPDEPEAITIHFSPREALHLWNVLDRQQPLAAVMMEFQEALALAFRTTRSNPTNEETTP